MFTAKATEKEAACVAELKKQITPAMLNKEDEGFLTDNTYLRFARARKADVAKSAEMLKKAIAWRNEAKPYAITEDEVKEAAKHLNIVCGGRCKEGCPIFAMSVIDPEGITMEARKKFLVFMLEETERKSYDRITWILTWAHMAKDKEKREDKEPDAKKHRKEVTDIMQNYYPERMNHVLIFHPPFLVRVMLPFMKMSIASVTSGKIHNIGTNVKDFDKYVARDQLPEVVEGSKPGHALEHFGALPPASELF
ncbi:CRAL/TRIO domain/Divergent CRAL/TRIO domain containing protein [Lotmaria passim]